MSVTEKNGLFKGRTFVRKMPNIRNFKKTMLVKVNFAQNGSVYTQISVCFCISDGNANQRFGTKGSICLLYYSVGVKPIRAGKSS